MTTGTGFLSQRRETETGREPVPAIMSAPCQCSLRRLPAQARGLTWHRRSPLFCSDGAAGSPGSGHAHDRGRFMVVLSTERSGSTLLTAMLNGNQRVLAPPEMHLVRYPDFDTWRLGKPDAVASLSWLMQALGQPADDGSLTSRFSGKNPVAVYQDLLSICGPSRILVDKTPAYARQMQVLQTIETLNPFYVWLVRHPLGVVASYLDRGEQRYIERRRKVRSRMKKIKLWLGSAYDRCFYLRGRYLQEKIAYWLDINTRIEAFLSGVPADRYLRIRFEELVRDPVAELERLCVRLGLELEPAMLHPDRNVPNALAWGIGNSKVLLHSTIDASVADRWRGRLDERILTRTTREIMKRIAGS
jgi:hypothetical protein